MNEAQLVEETQQTIEVETPQLTIRSGVKVGFQGLGDFTQTNPEIDWQNIGYVGA